MKNDLYHLPLLTIGSPENTSYLMSSSLDDKTVAFCIRCVDMAGPDSPSVCPHLSRPGDSHVSTVQFSNSTTSVLATLAALAEVSAPLSNSNRDTGRGNGSGADPNLCSSSEYLVRKLKEI